MRRIWRGLAAMMVLAASPALAQTDTDNSYPQVTISFQRMHQAVAAGFYDPASTRYRGMSVVDRFVMDLAVCGWVSSRNSRGVYTAYYPFGYRLKTGAVYIGINYLTPGASERTRLALSDFGCTAEALGL